MYYIAYAISEAAKTIKYGVLYDEYEEGKFIFIITDQKPPFTGDINRVCDLGFTDDEHDAITMQQLVRILDSPILTATDETNLGKLQVAGGLSPSLLTGIIEGFRQQAPNETMGLFSSPQIEWMYANHAAFKPVQTQI